MLGMGGQQLLQRALGLVVPLLFHVERGQVVERLAYQVRRMVSAHEGFKRPDGLLGATAAVERLGPPEAQFVDDTRIRVGRGERIDQRLARASLPAAISAKWMLVAASATNGLCG